MKYRFPCVSAPHFSAVFLLGPSAFSFGGSIKNTDHKTNSALFYMQHDAIIRGMFEPIQIYQPSIIVCSWLLIQLIVFGFAADGGHDVTKHNKSFFEQWFGFFVLLPTFIFDIGLFFYATLEQTASAKAIKKAAESVVMNISTRTTSRPYVKLDISADLSALPEKKEVAPGLFEELNPASLEAAKKADGGEEKIDGYQMTASDLARESSLNRVLVNKWIWTFPSTFLAACKLSFDTRRAYSWHVVFFPLYLYLLVLLVVAVAVGNVFMRNQRDIDRFERDKRRQLEQQRKRIREMLEQQDKSETDGVDF